MVFHTNVSVLVMLSFWFSFSLFSFCFFQDRFSRCVTPADLELAL